jgi:hypothetical protein
MTYPLRVDRYSSFKAYNFTQQSVKSLLLGNNKPTSTIDYVLFTRGLLRTLINQCPSSLVDVYYSVVERENILVAFLSWTCS